MVVLTAVLKTVSGKGDELEREFKKLTPKVLTDPGAITYIVHRAVDDPDKFLVYEQYENQDAFKYHGQTAHFKAYKEATKALVVGKTEVVFYHKVA